MEEALIGAISNVGVPSVIALFLLVRMQTSLDRLTEAIARLDSKLDSARH